VYSGSLNDGRILLADLEYLINTLFLHLVAVVMDGNNTLSLFFIIIIFAQFVDNRFFSPGEQFGIQQIKTILSTLLGRYDFELVNPKFPLPGNNSCIDFSNVSFLF
jgi:hypothetical protein